MIALDNALYTAYNTPMVNATMTTPSTPPLCSVEDCGRRISRREPPLCAMHEKRWLRHGDPLIKRRARGVMDVPVSYPPFSVRQQELIDILRTHKPLTAEQLGRILNITPNSARGLVQGTNHRAGFTAICSVWGRGYRIDTTNPKVFQIPALSPLSPLTPPPTH